MSSSPFEVFATTFKLSQRDILQYFDTKADWTELPKPKNRRSQRQKKPPINDHALTHSFFCKDYSCRFHHPYGV
jgi:hypothetical protein